MKLLAALFVALFLALPLSAQLLTDTPLGVVVAHEGRVQLANGWIVDGVRNATEIVASETAVAVLDALHDEVVAIELATGRATRTKTAATPIAAVFLGRDLYVLARDARVLQKIGGGNVDLAADPAFLRAANGRLYVYGRTSGVLEEIENDRVMRRADVAKFASDLELAGDMAYLTFPREARLRTVDLKTMKAGEAIDVGAVPVDLAVADPSAKRIWMTEGRQSTAKAIARGFLRGFIGLGLYGTRSSQFPTGVDRVLARGKRWLAYDSASGTLYRIDGRQSAIVAQGIGPKAFTLTETGIAFWKDGRLRDGTSVAEKPRQ
jgi:hypothetical protein